LTTDILVDTLHTEKGVCKKYAFDSATGEPTKLMTVS
jgi:hypothetical protein